MRTRLKDVADSLQLSPGLVSRVLNGRDVWASAETRARIIRAAEDLNYLPSSSARALSAGKTGTVALVYRRLPDVHYRLAYTGLVDVLSAELQGRGCSLAVANFATQEEVLDHLRFVARSHSCDAVVLWGREQDTEAQGELLESLGVPFLVKGRHERRHPAWFQVDFDHEGMMSDALNHVADLGHRRIAYLGFPLEDAFVAALRKGFSDAHLARFGETPDPRLFGECEDELAPNETEVERLMSLPAEVRPTGFVIGAGNYAWRALETSLARRSIFLGTVGGAAAAGTASFFFSLVFGKAMAFQGIEMDGLARSGCPPLLDAIVHGGDTARVVRYRPELTPAVTLDLLNQGLFPGHSSSARGGAPA
ncbi:MAG: LacI family DNA-binding transcriptional regulator [Fimbriimonadaceae bacterium]|nr:LacI family DNA-binding transcriptional regulator [Fimbriimonadaceae bacterium]